MRSNPSRQHSGLAARLPIDAESRTPEQIREHYEVERELAGRLRHAGSSERGKLYSSVYDELFTRVPLHPQLTRRSSARDTRLACLRQWRFICRFVTPESVFLEIGAGDCALALGLARVLRKVIAVDVSSKIAAAARPPANFTLIISDGSAIPVESQSVDVVYSNQLLEHLHPDDAVAQVREAHRLLVAGGSYVCVTPNRLSGPHDVSKYFDRVATGLHLREYSVTELARLFRKAGFSRLRTFVGARGVHVRVPAPLVLGFERLLQVMPERCRWRLAHSLPGRLALNVKVVGVK